MAMSRAQLTAALWGTLQRQFTEVGITNTDDSGNLKEPVDSTLLALGVAYSVLASGDADLIADGDEHKALIVARAYGLSTILDAALNTFDESIDAPNTTIKRSQFVTNIERALARANADAAPFISTAPSAWGAGTISLDYIEPCPTEYTA